MKGKDAQQGGFIGFLISEPQIWVRTGVLFCLAFGVMTLNLPFYGDQVTLVSAPASYIYEHGITSPLLPDDLATGHFPLFPMLVAGMWMVFGKHLAVTHILMVLCQLFMFIQVGRYAAKRLSDQARVFFLIVMLCYPVWWAQTAGMSADILLCGLFFLGLNASEHNRNLRWILVIMVLPMVSIRGWIWALALCVHAWDQAGFKWKVFLQIAARTLLGLLPIIAYYIWEHQLSGWWLVPVDERYGGHRGLVDGRLLAGKSFEFVLRCLEFGMLIPLLFVKFYSWHSIRASLRNPDNRLALIAAGCLALFTLPFRGPILIRYMMPLQILVMICFAGLLVNVGSKRLRIWMVGATAVLCLSQHFFAYPQMRSSIFEYDWSGGSMSHVSMFVFRQEAKTFLDEQGVEMKDVGTYFPEYKPFSLTDLQGTTDAYTALGPGEIPTQEWLIYSNVMNVVTAPMLEQIKREYTEVRSWESYPVHYVIYRRKAE